MARILIPGGYGAVGREAATAITALMPTAEVVVAGRNPAHPIPGTTSMRVDLADDAGLAGALDGVDTALMCAELDNVRVARACLDRGIHYLDVSASYPLLAGIEALDDLARERAATAVLSVGLAPGISNLLAKHCVDTSGARDVCVGVLLGSGERHGPAAIRWTIDGLGTPGRSWPMTFPAPFGRRTVHQFPFSDQHSLPRTLGLDRASTGLCLDSRPITALLAAARRPALSRLLHRPAVRGALESILTKVHLGGDGFAVTAETGSVRASLSGRRQSRATGVTAALLVERLPSFPPGVRHIDELVDPVPFLEELATRGFSVEVRARKPGPGRGRSGS